MLVFCKKKMIYYGNCESSYILLMEKIILRVSRFLLIITWGCNIPWSTYLLLGVISVSGLLIKKLVKNKFLLYVVV